MKKSKEQLAMEEDLKKRGQKGQEHSLTPTQEQMLMSKHKYENKMKIAEITLLIHEKSIELEKLKHSNIMEEIKEMKKQGVKSLNR